MNNLHFSTKCNISEREAIYELLSNLVDEEYLLRNVPDGEETLKRLEAFYEGLYGLISREEAEERYEDFVNVFTAVSRSAYLQGVEHGMRLLSCAKEGRLVQEVIKLAY